MENSVISVEDGLSADNRRTAALSALFAPQSVAIIGASNDAAKMSGRPLANFRRFGFPGEIYPVNPRYAEVQGYRAYPSIGDIGAPIDLTLIMTPAAATIDAVRDGLAAGSRSFIIYAAGYAEFNEAGARLQSELGELMTACSARLLGPNCTGMINCHANVCATFSTVVDQMAMTRGGISFVGQSGAMAAYWLEKTLQAGLGFAKWISTGNEADVSLADAILHLATDETTQCICAYIEGARDGFALRNAFEVALAAGKPVLVLRSGKSVEGALAAASHTGAMAGEDAVWRSLFRQTGVIECSSLNAMVNVTKLLRHRPAHSARRPLIMSVSGGAGALTADAASQAGLHIAPLPLRLRESVQGILPDLGNLANPLDLTATVASNYSLFTRTAAAVVDDDSFDSFIIFLGLMHNAKDEIPRAISEVLGRSGKPVVLIWMSASEGVKAELRRHEVVAYDDIPDAIDAVAAWNGWYDARPLAGSPSRLPASLRATGGRILSEHAGQRLLGPLTNLRWPEAVLVADARALSDADLPAGPWAVKLQSGQMPHKTEHGGVVVNIRERDTLAARVDLMVTLGKRLRIVIDGVLVQQMVPHDHELLVGIRTDPIFGPLLVVGRGGTEAEYEKDLTLRLLPLSLADIEEMLRGLRYADRLAGVRGKAGIDFARLAAAIAALCSRYEADPSILEIEINPLAVSASGEIVPLDLLITVADKADAL
jgi:acyl-CoA synthetase (NDP forming)